MKLKSVTKRFLLPVLIILLVITIYFPDVIFFKKSLTTSSITRTTTKTGSYQYNEKQSEEKPVIDVGASAWHWEPAVKVNADIYKDKKIPLWNPYIANGQPLAADMQSSSFYLFQLLMVFSQKPLVWNIFLLLRIFLAAVFAFLFFKEIGVSKKSSYIAVIIYALSGYFVCYINMSHLNVDILLPFVLYSFVLLKKKPKKYWPLASLGIFLSITGGMPEPAFLVISFALIFFLYLFFTEKEWKQNFSSIYYFLLSIFVGFLSSTFLLSIFIEFVKNASHLHEGGQWILPYKSFASILSPYFYGTYIPWSELSIHKTLPYVSVVGLFVAIVGWKKGKISNFFSGYILFYILVAFGIIPALITSNIPLFNQVIFFKYGFNIFILSIAVLAGISLDNLEIKPKKAIIVLITWIAAMVVFILLNRAHVDGQNIKYILLNISRTTIFLSLALALLLIKKIPKRTVVYLVGALIVIELLVYMPRNRPIRYDPYKPSPEVKYLQKNTKLDRFITLNGTINPNVGAAYKLFDARGLNALNVKGYLDVWKYISTSKSGHVIGYKDNVVIDHPFIDLMGVKYIVADSLEGTANPVKGKDNLKLPLTIKKGERISFRFDVPDGAKLLKVKAKGEGELVVRIYGENKDKDYENSIKLSGKNSNNWLPIKKGRKSIYLTTSEEAVIDSFDLRYSDNKVNYQKKVVGESSIYLNKNILPRAFIVSKAIKQKKNWQKQIEEIDIDKEAIVNSYEEEFKEGKNTSEIIEYSTNKVRINAFSENGGVLLLTDTYYPGWKCLIDNKEVKIRKGNYLFRAVVIPPGKHRIVFQYYPKSFYIGLLVSIITIVTAFILWGAIFLKGKLSKQ